jgi:hypothetical protein
MVERSLLGVCGIVYENQDYIRDLETLGVLEMVERSLLGVCGIVSKNQDYIRDIFCRQTLFRFRSLFCKMSLFLLISKAIFKVCCVLLPYHK